MTRYALPLSVSLCMAASHVAADECDSLHDLATYVSSVSAPKDPTCNTYLGQGGGSGVACHWEFNFRSAAATDFAEAIWAEIKSCGDGRAADPDALVNHPDSYDLRAWVDGGRTYWVSVKDKGALDRTLVFVRSEERQ